MFLNKLMRDGICYVIRKKIKRGIYIVIVIYVWEMSLKFNNCL